jgi:hypothetical protein
MNMTAAYRFSKKKVTREQGIPFEASVDPFYSERNITAGQIEQGNVVVETLE